ncbi:cytochrome c biogenesis CcdA family protein [Nonomuraea sp. M3C6]|uniref:Cytochrome c biogenesis CcdA family protein n=1 Tax=Nonomuraea marmarensis TaxID=3351344 RepID=A0ABW7AXN6_9ACTN
MGELLLGTTLLTSFLGGIVALLAPCCVSVMLPAYLASAMHRRGGVLPATLVFAAGVAVVILPIGLGAAALAAAFQRYHLVLFSAGGALMLLAGLAVLAGWQPKLPMPAGRSRGRGAGAVFMLGLFSGVASACCAPVLVGVVVLAGASASFPAALAVGLTYVAGMVAPLVVLSLLWERSSWTHRVLHRRQVRLAGRTMALGSLLSGLLLLGMGALTVVLALTGPAMPNSGWQVTFSADLQHGAAVVTGWLSWLPGWAFAAVLVAAAVLVIRRVRRAGSSGGPESEQEPVEVSVHE